MMARVRLDAGHVSKSTTARREKVTRYIRALNKLSEVTHVQFIHFTLASDRAVCERDLHGSSS